jgi:hypothetical protein
MLLVKKKLKKLVLVVTDIATKEALERWQFDIETTANIEWDFGEAIGSTHSLSIAFTVRKSR